MQSECESSVGVTVLPGLRIPCVETSFALQTCASSIPTDSCRGGEGQGTKHRLERWWLLSLSSSLMSFGTGKDQESLHLTPPPMPITFSSFDNPGCIVKSFLYCLISAAESRFKEIQMRRKPSGRERWLSVKCWPWKSEDCNSIPRTHGHRIKSQTGQIDVCVCVERPNQASPLGSGAGQSCLWGRRDPMFFFLSGHCLRNDTQCFPLACTCMSPTGTTYKHAHPCTLT